MRMQVIGGDVAAEAKVDNSDAFASAEAGREQPSHHGRARLRKRRWTRTTLKQEVVAHNDLAVVHAASLILAQPVKGHAAQIITGDHIDVLAGVVNLRFQIN